MAEIGDAVLVERSVSGDTEAYGILVERYKAAVYSTAYSYIGNPADAGELTQEVFLKAYASLDTLKDATKFAGWVRSITNNLVKDFMKKKRVSTVSMTSEVWGQAASTEDTPDLQIDKERVSIEIRKAIDSLPQKYKMIIYLRYFEDLSYQEIATYLDVPFSTVDFRLRKAKSMLRKKLAVLKSESEE